MTSIRCAIRTDRVRSMTYTSCHNSVTYSPVRLFTKWSFCKELTSGIPSPGSSKPNNLSFALVYEEAEHESNAYSSSLRPETLLPMT
jgi:hypothetical protein